MSRRLTLRYNPHSVFSIKAHLVLVTAYRRKVITDTILADLEEHTVRVCQMADTSVHEFSGESDHIHVLLEMNPSIAPAKLVNTIKTVTSRMVRRDHWPHVKTMLWGKRFWSLSYCLISVGDGATTEIIKRYIQNQLRPN